MGNKANPISIRLGTNYRWDSKWISKNFNNNYSNLLIDDNLIKKFIISYLQQNFIYVQSIKIERISLKTIIIIQFIFLKYFNLKKRRYISKKKKKLLIANFYKQKQDITYIRKHIIYLSKYLKILTKSDIKLKLQNMFFNYLNDNYYDNIYFYSKFKKYFIRKFRRYRQDLTMILAVVFLSVYYKNTFILTNYVQIFFKKNSKNSRIKLLSLFYFISNVLSYCFSKFQDIPNNIKGIRFCLKGKATRKARRSKKYIGNYGKMTFNTLNNHVSYSKSYLPIRSGVIGFKLYYIY